MIFRALTANDKADIVSVMDSRRGLNLVGVTWTPETVVKELLSSDSLGFFSRELDAFIVFKDISPVIEILLIYSRKGVAGAGEQVLKSLIAAFGQFSDPVEEIWLEVHEDNASAIRFYEQQGFIQVSRRSNYYPDGKAALNFNLHLKR